ncbi:MAG: flagellar biosynthetic protein FliO [Planctomycetota bacterium]|nr:flagellar biosynthetic protein FliO [Planctomycetota bacterium]
MASFVRQIVVVAVVVLAFSSFVWSQSATQAHQDGDAETKAVGSGARDVEDRHVGRDGGPAVWPWLQTVLALAVVIVLIFLARWLLRRVGAVTGTGRSAGLIEVLARSSLSPRHQLFLVRLGQRLILVGAGPQGGLAALTEITDQAEVSRLVEVARGGGRPEVDSSVREVAQKIRSKLSAESTKDETP